MEVRQEAEGDVCFALRDIGCVIPAQALGSVLLCRTDYKSQSRYGETESSVVLQV